jgi:hypothetical protein
LKDPGRNMDAGTSASIHIVLPPRKFQAIQKFPGPAEKETERFHKMANTVTMIGIDPTELGSIRLLVFLLRHPDPMVPELTRQALRHIEQVAANRAVIQPDIPGHAGGHAG